MTGGFPSRHDGLPAPSFVCVRRGYRRGGEAASAAMHWFSRSVPSRAWSHRPEGNFSSASHCMLNPQASPHHPCCCAWPSGIVAPARLRPASPVFPRCHGLSARPPVAAFLALCGGGALRGLLCCHLRRDGLLGGLLLYVQGHGPSRSTVVDRAAPAASLLRCPSRCFREGLWYVVPALLSFSYSFPSFSYG